MAKKAYSYEVHNGKYLITGYTTDVNFHNIHRVLGKCKPIGKRSYYEEVEIMRPYPSYKRFNVLVKRSEITFKIIHSLLFDETIQSSSLSELIQDEDLLKDMGIEVLTRKRYYSQPYPHVVDEYQIYKKEEVNDELIKHLEELSNNELEIYESEMIRRNAREKELEEYSIVWHKI